ncbi:MAG TPA: thioredoxin domain-containing protein [Actinocrinis sp.]|uniref:thioredoxin domain-containing protein n=1 Tax=Actinocrinis sp. TaxID=1920516 RepID=UPI002DDCA87D|nr:thioredoxin domain-containing protein [Actinocrinis sp.]HEV2344878.1 thioredoxin domain-containing protein [Actinocrinis sp.]
MNRLGSATSPYLLQHADNPVDWWQWGEDAFAEARRRDVPLLISIGYAACHWCHVMAHESFEDAETAALMNAGFVCVKVDREERPDVDAVYMTATQAMTGHGGWPMTVFATPAGKPFYCGTYYPAQSRGGMPSFRTLLDAVGTAWREQRSEIERVGDDVAERLARTAAPVGSGAGGGTSAGSDADAGGAPDSTALAASVARLVHEFDSVHGGFGGAPKFPPSMTLLQLLRHHARTGSPQALDMVRRTCFAMARGGIFDQLGGGFARYAVDGTWTVPHFEKMLYDNALLLRVYTLLYKATVDGAESDGGAGVGAGAEGETGKESAFFARVALQTVKFLIGALRTSEGGFASALDADTNGVEGLTYVWTPSQLRSVLGDSDGEWAADFFHVTSQGTFEDGASVLEMLGDPAPDEAARYHRARITLAAAREERPQPRRDGKVVAAWNGLAITALVEASLAFEMPRLLDVAVDAARLLADVHVRDARLVRTSRDGVASANPGVLEDYGCVAEGFCVLYSATGDKQWLDLAAGLLETVREQFVSDAGFHDTAADADSLYFRPSDPTDNATPSGASAAAAAFVAYAVTAGSLDHLDDAHRALGAASQLADRAPRFAGYGLAVAEALLSDVPAAFVCPGPFCA